MTTTRNAVIIAIVAGFALAAIKLYIGIAVNGAALIAEATDALINAITAILVAVAVYFAAKGYKNADHYGAEIALTALFIAGTAILVNAVERIVGAGEGIDLNLIYIAVAVQVVGILVNAGVIRYVHAAAHEHKADSLHAVATEITGDLVTAVGVIVGVVAVIATGYVILDAIVALIIVGVIYYNGIRAYKELHI